MKGIKFLLLCFFLLSAVSAVFAEYEMRVNCNGPDYVDTRGRLWLADPLNYNGSDRERVGGWEYVYSYDVANTQDDPLYQKSFYALDWYHFPVANGQYQVTLKFAEPFYSNPNKRIMSIRIEGNKVINRLDVPATYGKGRAFDKTFVTNVTDEKLSIQFIHEPRPEGGTYAHAFINAIEIIEVGTSPATLELDKDQLNINLTSKFATFSISNQGDESLTWSLAESPDVAWLSRITPTSGTIMKNQSQQVYVYIDRDGLTTGDYQTHILITSNAGTKDIPVTLHIKESTPFLTVRPEQLLFSGPVKTRIFRIENAGNADGAWSATITSDKSWLETILPDTGTVIPGTEDSVAVSINPENLQPGVNRGSVTVTTPRGQQSIDIVAFQQQDTLRMNCGGADYLDESGHYWLSDFGYTGGTANYLYEEIENSDDDELFQRARVGECQYHIPVQYDGLYQVTLYFAEIRYRAPDFRIFDVWLENEPVVENLDAHKEAGFGYPVTRTVQTIVRDKKLDLKFVSQLRDPRICAIEIVQLSRFPAITSPGHIAVNEDELLAYTVTAGDPDDDPVQISLTQLASWLTYDGSDVTGIPGEGIADTAFLIIASDGVLEDSLTVQVDVIPVNDPPEITSPTTVSAREDSVFHYVATAVDPDSPDLVFTFQELPSWLSISQNTASGTPLEGTLDSHFVLIVSDGQLADTAIVHIEVAGDNDPPAFLSLGKIEAVEDEFFSYTATAVDPDGDPIEFSFRNLPCWLTADENRVSGTPREGATDTLFTVIASDGVLADSMTVQIQVMAVNDPPKITSAAAVTAVEDEAFTYAATATDPENDAVTFSFKNYPAWMAPLEATISGTPLEAAVDTSFLTIATDGELFDTLHVMVELNGINDPPVITSPAEAYAVEDELFTYRPTGQDPEGNALHFIMENGPTWLTASDTLIFGTPRENDSDTSFVLVIDDGALADTLAVQVWVAAVNDPPKITSPAIADAREDEAFTYAATWDDPEGDVIQIWFENYPDWLTANQNTVTGTPGENAGDTSFTVLASDGELADTLQVLLRVGAVNDPPRLSLPKIFEFRIDSIVTFNLPDVVSDPDDPIETLSWTVTLDPPQNIQFTIDSTLTATVSALSPDSTTATITVTDPGGLSDQAQITIIARGNTGIDGVQPGKMQEYQLAQNYPNPFNPETQIQFSLPELTRLSIQIFDATGRQVAELLNQVKPAGSHSITWNAAAQSSGIYYIVMKTPKFTQTRKCILLK